MEQDMAQKAADEGEKELKVRSPRMEVIHRSGS
jgi:hypothetical protein